jgi:DNA-binding GntR family transcriptional regulator
MPVPLGLAHRSLRDAVRDELRTRIVDGSLAAGSRLVERQLADELGVSRIPVREALRELASEGFVESRPRRGMVVRGLSSEDVDELFDLREALEVLVCRRAAVRLDGPGGEALQAVLDEAGDALAAGDVDAAVGANARFHAVLLQVSRSPALQSVLDPVNGRLQWLLRQHPDPQVLYEEHRAIADAVRAGDAGRAAELAGRHLRTSRQQYERAARALGGPA